MGGQSRHRWRIAAWLMLGAAIAPGLQAVRAEDAPRSLGDLYRALKSQQQDMAARQMREKALRGEAEPLSERVGQLSAQMIETAARLQAQEDKVSALETALAESTARDAALKQNLDRNDRSVAQTLTALERIALRPPAAIIARPVNDAVDTIRTAMLLGAVVPTIEADATRLRTQIEDLRVSRRRTEARRASLAEASQALGAERTKLAGLVKAKQDQETGKRAEAAQEGERAKAISAKADDLKDLIASLEKEAAARRAAAKARAA
jgi:septal ring factor EnvC (AmiA/AmiB activator)